ncbi:MAG: bacteriohemerythrin [Rhodocyclaceae bacterium]|nr:bacteriohemerythrin [Rhodocyclaceae bacterium]
MGGIVEWTDSLLTGIDEIDQQHQTLFTCLERLEKTVSFEERWSAVHFALDEVENFTRIHFVVEEALLRLHAYPLLAAHILEHRLFISKLEKLKEQSLRADVSDNLVKLLKDWLINHIGKTDSHYVTHLRTAPVAAVTLP